MINILSGMEATASALNAERVRMDIVGQNIANAQVTRGIDGKPYQRQQVVFETLLDASQGNAALGRGDTSMVRVARVELDGRGPRMIHNPTHPDANAEGMVAMPNVNIHEEMADMIVASRAFEANLAVIKNARQLAMQALSIGKR